MPNRPPPRRCAQPPRALRLLALLASGAACQRPAAPPAATSAPAAGPAEAGVPLPAAFTEREPNDTLETAQLITGGGLLSGALSAVQPATRPDEDWYQVRPPSPQDVAVGLDGFAGRLTVELYDRDHEKMFAQAGVAPLRLPLVRVRDRLFIRVAGSGTAGPYQLRLESTTPDPDREAEPNNRPVDATPLALDHPIHGAYGSEGDADFYDLVLEAGGSGADSATGAATGANGQTGQAEKTAASGSGAGAGSPADAGAALGAAESAASILRITVSGIPLIRHALNVFDPAGTPLASFLGREPGADLEVRDLAIPAGAAHLILELESAAVRKQRPFSDAPYTLSVHREPAPPDVEREPNDTLAEATPVALPPGATVRRSGWLAPEGDVDTYRLHLDAPARIRLQLSALDRVDAELSVVDADPAAAVPNSKSKLLLKVNEGGPKEGEVIPAIVLGAGDHYAIVRAAPHQVGSKWVRDQFDPQQTYSLEFTSSADDGTAEREPNDTAATATPIAIGQILEGYAFPAKDVDLYKLDLSAQPVAIAVALKLTGVPKVPLTLEVRDSQGDALGPLLNSADPGKPGLAGELQQKLEPAVYYLLVRPHPSIRAAGTPQADAETAYRLSVTAE